MKTREDLDQKVIAALAKTMGIPVEAAKSEFRAILRRQPAILDDALESGKTAKELAEMLINSNGEKRGW